MSLETEFSEILTELTKFQSTIGRVHTGLKSQKEQEILGDLLSKINEARAQAETAVPEAIRRIHEVAQDVQQRAEEQKRKLAELQQQIEQRKQNERKAPAPVAKPDVQFDPNLGQQLAQELLEHVAIPAVPEGKPAQMIKEIWEDWNWDSFDKN